MLYNDDHLLYLALASAPGMTCDRYEKLLEMFDSPQEIWENIAVSNTKLSFLGSKLIYWLCDHKDKKYITEYVKELENNRVSAVCMGMPDYPQALKNIPNPPSVLYYKGDLSIVHQDNSVGIVGSRRCTYYGKNTAKRFAYELAQAGLPIISGLARGIDTQAHIGALEAKGRTVGVLGCGLNVVYPPENKRLYDEMEDRGLILSEFPLSTPPLPSNFPRRNRIISGLSRGLVVIEAAIKSGALITANCAIDQGRDVFFVPGNIDSPASSGTNMMIKEGMPAVLSPEDVLESWGLLQSGQNSQSAKKEQSVPQLNEQELSVVNLLLERDMSMDELCNSSPLTAAELGSLLTMLEMRDIVSQLPGRVYTLTQTIKSALA